MDSIELLALSQWSTKKGRNINGSGTGIRLQDGVVDDCDDIMKPPQACEDIVYVARESRKVVNELLIVAESYVGVGQCVAFKSH